MIYKNKASGRSQTVRFFMQEIFLYLKRNSRWCGLYKKCGAIQSVKYALKHILCHLCMMAGAICKISGDTHLLRKHIHPLGRLLCSHANIAPQKKNGFGRSFRLIVSNTTDSPVQDYSSESIVLYTLYIICT